MRRSFQVSYHAASGSWRWECTMCWPPARGARFGPDAWDKIMRISLPRHFRVRWCHHKWVAQNRR